ncbi:Binding-protein-dependent transport system inner membrane component [Paramicrobacterium humi]|uniref:Binding-protein-dependent transport system inner membrane component n=1 Tax=Paramicrobacterium humi TaxID=640635 RepID=A0A1H4K930_9MICO|nr:ABC transporter permease subunit [Microbacterium humi]SEB54796.1 Binding-protein-dependent transport system inner membrane component [Microbacterium humi]
MRFKSWALTLCYGLAGILVLVAVWSVLAATHPGTARFPSLLFIAETIDENLWNSAAIAYASFGTGGIVSNVLSTAVNVLIAVAVGLVVGYAVGIALVRSRRLANLSSLSIALLGTLPVLVLHPFLTLWFGVSQIAMGGMVVFYTILTIIEAVRSSTARAQDRWGDYSASLGLSGPGFITSVLVPASLPATLGTARAAVAFGWGFQALAEVLGGASGAGRLVRTFADATNTAGVIGVLICLGIVALITDAVIAALGKWAVRWNE